MKKTSFALISLAAIVLVLLTGQAFAQGVAVARSYENYNTYRLLAGFGIYGSVNWNSHGLTRYYSNTPAPESPVWFKDCKGDVTLNSYGVPGRWFVDRGSKSFLIYDTSLMKTASSGILEKALERKNTNSLTPVFTDMYLVWSDNLKEFVWTGSGWSAGAGKFNTMKLRVEDPEGNESFYFIGDSDTGSWKYSRSYTAEQLINGMGKYGPYCEAVWHIDDANLDVKITTHCLYDQARFDFQITNLGETSLKVGFAMTGSANVWEFPQNHWFDKGDPSSGWYKQRGMAFYYMPGIGMATRPKTLNSKQIPEKMDIYGYLYAAGAGKDMYGFPKNSDDMISHATFTFTGNDATKPDYITVDNSYFLLGMGDYTRDCIAGNWQGGEEAWHDDGGFPTANVWPEPGQARAAYTPDPTYVFEEYEAWPTVYMVTWKSQEILPAKTRRIVAYYGEGDMDFATGSKIGKNFIRDSFITMVECPTNMNYDADEDAVTPQEFTVTATIANCSCEKTNFDIDHISFTIDLPEKGHEGYCGLLLADGESATKKWIGKVKQRSFASVSWKVKVVGDVSGDISFNVQSNGKYIGEPSWQHPDLDSDYWTQTVTRTISFPTTKSGTITQDWTLMSSPFNGTDYTVDDIFGEGNAVLYYWDPVLGTEDKYISEKNMSKITPGQGFWIGKDKGMKTIDFFYPDDALPNDINTGDSDYINDRHVTLYTGWNIVGNPYVFPVQWLGCNVRNKRTGDVCSITEAVEREKWMGASVYGWNEEKHSYTVQNSVKAQLLPNTGYWVYVYEPLEIIYNPASIPGTSVTIDGVKYPLAIPVD